MDKNYRYLEFAVALAQQKLSDLRPGDLLNLRDDLQSFFARAGEDMRGPFGEVITPFESPLPHEYSVEDFEALQRDVSTILNEMVAGRDTGMPSLPVRRISARLELLSFPGIKNRAFLLAKGTTRDMFLLRLFFVLSNEPLDRILRCKAPDCDRLFYRKRKQEFCSTRCTNRAYMKDYRKDPGFAETARDEAHNRYAQRVKKAEGRTVERRKRVSVRK